MIVKKNKAKPDKKIIPAKLRIFRIIEGASSSDQLEEYFEAKHNTKAEFLCKGQGVEYKSVESSLNLESELEELFYSEKTGISLLEVQTPAKLNDQVLNDYFNRTKKLIHQE